MRIILGAGQPLSYVRGSAKFKHIEPSRERKGAVLAAMIRIVISAADHPFIPNFHSPNLFDLVRLREGAAWGRLPKRTQTVAIVHTAYRQA